MFVATLIIEAVKLLNEFSHRAMVKKNKLLIKVNKIQIFIMQFYGASYIKPELHQFCFQFFLDKEFCLIMYVLLNIFFLQFI